MSPNARDPPQLPGAATETRTFTSIQAVTRKGPYTVKILFVLSFIVLNMMFYTPDSHADVGCGSVLAGGTFENPSRHVLTRDLRCYGTRGIRMPHSNTILDCQNHTISHVGPRGTSIGIFVGGSQRSERRHILNCGAMNWHNGIRVYNADTTLIERKTGTTAFRSNQIGIFVQNSSLPVLLGVTTPANDDKGMLFMNTWRPSVVSSSSNSNHDSGMFFANSTESLIRNSEARRNGDPDIVFAQWSHHGYMVDSIFDEMFFDSTATNNHWCRVIHGNVWNPGPTNFEWCQ